MDSIRFKLKDLYDVLGEYEDDLAEFKDPIDIEEQNGNSYTVDNFKIVIPRLHVAFRSAVWCTLNPEMDPDDDEAWEAVASVDLMYEENEKDINNWKAACTDGFELFLDELCKKAGYPKGQEYELDCYIEFDECV